MPVLESLLKLRKGRTHTHSGQAFNRRDPHFRRRIPQRLGQSLDFSFSLSHHEDLYRFLPFLETGAFVECLERLLGGFHGVFSSLGGSAGTDVPETSLARRRSEERRGGR